MAFLISILEKFKLEVWGMGPYGLSDNLTSSEISPVWICLISKEIIKL